MKTSFFPFAALAACAVLAACSGSDDDEAAEPAETPAETPRAPAPEGALPTRPGDMPSQPPLQILTAADTGSVTLDGELGCSFLKDGGSGSLLVAMGYADSDQPSEAMIKTGGEVRTLTGTAPDGFSGMLNGTAWEGGELTVTLTPTSPDRADHEGSVRDATLSVSYADGTEIAHAGSWSCGP